MLKALISRLGSPAACRFVNVAAGLAAAIVFICAAGAAIFLLTAGATDPRRLAAAVGLLAGGSILVWTFERAAELAAQRRRDLRAAAIADALAAGAPPPEPFCVYLRPFLSTDEVREAGVSLSAAPHADAAMMGALGAAREFELESQIERATRSIGVLVALGEPLEHIGAGRIKVSDAEWREAARKLVEAARLIVLLPSARPGTLWEIDKILGDGLAERTVVIDPPNGSVKGRRFDHEGEWEAVRAAFAQHGYDLPPNSARGRMVFYGGERGPVLSRRFSVTEAGAAVRMFKAVARRLGPRRALAAGER